MEASSFFAALDPLRIALVAVAAFAGSLAAGLSGLGGGMLLAIVIAPIVGIEVLVPVMTVTMLLNHVARVGARPRHGIRAGVSCTLRLQPVAVGSGQWGRSQ